LALTAKVVRLHGEAQELHAKAVMDSELESDIENLESSLLSVAGINEIMDFDFIARYQYISEIVLHQVNRLELDNFLVENESKCGSVCENFRYS
jgi:hypothetical protein